MPAARSESTFKLLDDADTHICEARGLVFCKGKGEVPTWWLVAQQPHYEPYTFAGAGASSHDLGALLKPTSGGIKKGDGGETAVKDVEAMSKSRISADGRGPGAWGNNNPPHGSDSAMVAPEPQE